MRITKLVVVLLCAGALIGCAHNSPDAETRDSGASVGAGSLADELYRSSQAFQKARESSDAVGMAKAVARRPVVIEESLELSEEFLLWRDMTERMKMQTLDMAKDDASTLAIVEDILSRDPPKENELGAFGKNITGIIGSAEKPAAKKAFRLDPGERVELFHRARKSRGSIVYVEGAEDSGLRLVIRDAEHREICRDASPHGVLICRWRPKENGRVKVVIENAGSAPARALLISAE